MRDKQKLRKGHHFRLDIICATLYPWYTIWLRWVKREIAYNGHAERDANGSIAETRQSEDGQVSGCVRCRRLAEGGVCDPGPLQRKPILRNRRIDWRLYRYLHKQRFGRALYGAVGYKRSCLIGWNDEIVKGKLSSQITFNVSSAFKKSWLLIFRHSLV